MLSRGPDGKMEVSHPHQTTGEAFGSMALRSYHRNMLRLAEAAIEETASRRHLRGLTFSIPEDCYDDLVEQLTLFIDKLRAIIEERRDCDHVYHLEMALFPLTKASNRRGRR